MKLLAWGAVSLLLIAGCANAETGLQQEDSELTLSNASHVIVVSPERPTVALKLKANPTTGYSWILGSYDHHLMKAAGYHYYPAVTGGAVGEGGYAEFDFVLKPEAFSVPQRIEISLQYARPWGVVSKTQEMVFTVMTRAK